MSEGERTSRDRAASSWAEEVDLLVVGAGAGGMATALFASLRGLSVLICEKSTMVGGTTATSAGTIWAPGTRQSARAGVLDTTDAARTYLQSALGPIDPDGPLEAFLANGPEVVEELETRTEVKFVAAKAHPDYLGNRPGAAYGGRALAPVPFDGRRLGRDFERVRPPRPEFMVLGGMMVAKDDIPALLNPFGSLAALRRVTGLLLRYGLDRLRHRRGTRLVMGNALVARLLYSLKQRQVPIAYDTGLVELRIEAGRVSGAVLNSPEGQRRVRAHRAVVLATGGVGWNANLRAELYPESARAHSLACDAVRGDGIMAAREVGAHLHHPEHGAGLWMPCSVLKQPDGRETLYPHIILDRAKPGLLAVNASGCRFTNEADSYHDFVTAMLRVGPAGTNLPAHLICDRSFIHDYGIGLIHPGRRDLRPYLHAGYLIEGETPRDLAARLDIDPDRLERTIADYNRYAVSGTDEAFGRGSTDLNRVNGDPGNRPNPCLRPIGSGPLYSVAVFPADLASSAGLEVDHNGCALSADRRPIEGLFACGADAASIFAGTYPGPGTTLGPALVMAERIATYAARRTTY